MKLSSLSTISETFWRTSSDNVLRKYNYGYEALNRLRQAVYEKPDSDVPNSYGEALSYDKNGNIMSLQLNGNLDDYFMTVQIDDLSYAYANNSNQLMKVTDGTNNTNGFKDDSDGTNDNDDDYRYDDNGNMLFDQNKGIIEIVYNHLNLPTKIIFEATGEITYIYNAMGQKVEKLVVQNGCGTCYNGQSIVKTDYLDGFQYKNAVLQFFPTAEGYVNYFKENFNYVYNYTDHLGNIRLSYGIDPKTLTLKIIEENHYYPFGLKHSSYNTSLKGFKDVVTNGIVELDATGKAKLTLKQIGGTGVVDKGFNYKYNGKELQEELGLNVYDYGARGYMPDIGRWGQIDPLAEMYRRHTTYAYAVNNPVYFLDPDGMKVINGNEADRDKALKERDAKKAEFNSNYSSNDMKRKDFSSKKEFKAYKSAREGLANAESNYKSAESKFQQTQATIDEFKSVDPEGFAQVDNLKNGVTGSNIDVVVKYGAVDPNFAGASTSPSVWPSSYSNQELGGDGNINITFDGSSKFGRGVIIAHEFGHAVGIASEPYESYYSIRVAENQYKLFGNGQSLNCQNPFNRDATFAKTAMDWQERFIMLQKTMKP